MDGTTDYVMDMWMGSSGHRANILNENFTDIGVGVVESDGYYYWVQLFPRAAIREITFPRRSWWITAIQTVTEKLIFLMRL